MSKVNYEIVKNDDRLFFCDGKQYVLFDSVFFGRPSGNSASVNGMMGPFSVNTMDDFFFKSFINLTIDGNEVTAVFNPMDGYNCLLKGNTLTITDEAMEVSDCEYFFPFVDANLPLIDGALNGEKCRFLFDSGARFTMFGERSVAKEKVRTYTEWMAMKHCHEELDVYKLNLTFPNGFSYEGEGALVTDARYLMAAKMMGIKAMLGIDIFNYYDMAIITKGAKRGIALLKK